ncbi:hypothetical protein OPV22_032683 [Ensete ventricosum]|uniref:Uncharacterized protein n=1 Tax=Ensete ventricosum TaxID=4639 RepID=A0AAV8PW34_ENSVE|nr:hypothetical protein OPV22_032683 [Ensete ventricosum]
MTKNPRATRGTRSRSSRTLPYPVLWLFELRRALLSNGERQVDWLKYMGSCFIRIKQATNYEIHHGFQRITFCNLLERNLFWLPKQEFQPWCSQQLLHLYKLTFNMVQPVISFLHTSVKMSW